MVNRNTRRGPQPAAKLSREALFVSPAGLMSAMVQLPSVAEIDEMVARGAAGTGIGALEGSSSDETDSRSGSDGNESPDDL